MMPMTRTIGIIAGRGIYPQTFVDAARAQGCELRLVLTAVKNETESSLTDQVDRDRVVPYRTTRKDD